MDQYMDQSLDEIIASKSTAPSGASSGGVGKAPRRPRAPRSRDRQGGRPRIPSGPRGGRNLKAVCIRNLSPKITEDDLRDLFREVGPVSSTVLDTDGRNKRTGIAWVLYKFPEDAAVAAGRYNGRKAAGQIISVSQVTNIGDAGVSLGKPLGDRIGSSANVGSGRNAKRQKKPKRAARPAPQKKSQEDLDAELDAYMADEPTGISSAPAPAQPPVSQEDISI